MHAHNVNIAPPSHLHEVLVHGNDRGEQVLAGVVDARRAGAPGVAQRRVGVDGLLHRGVVQVLGHSVANAGVVVNGASRGSVGDGVVVSTKAARWQAAQLAQEVCAVLGFG